MTLIAPSRLWLLVGVLALAVAYVVVARTRRRPAVRHPDLALLDAIAPRWPGWRRHLTAVGLLAALVALVVGLARPAREVEVQRDEAVVILAVDVSRSMEATDVSPNRLAAAKEAAKDFVDDAPEGYRIGLISFSAEARTVASPTTDRAELLAAIDSLQPSNGTAAGDGLAMAVDVLEADVAEQPPTDDETYRAVILLADGDSQTGVPLGDAAQQAADAEIPVFTIAYGTPDATVVVDGRTVDAGADPASIAAVAEATGGTDHTATSGAELSEVYDQIGTTIDADTEEQELTVALALVAAVLLSLTIVAATAWNPRLT